MSGPFKARDGRGFATAIQREKYERWEDLHAKAPGGAAHDEAVRLHGPANTITIRRVRTGGGTRFEVEAKHDDGFTYKGAHPEDHVAGEVANTLIGINPPLAIDTHARTRNQPTGQKEEERVAQEDGREVAEG